MDENPYTTPRAETKPSIAERSKSQFRMRDLLWAAGLIGASLGLGLLLLGSSKPASPFDVAPMLELLALFVGASAAFGAGVGRLFRVPLWGAVGGVVLMTIVASVTLAIVPL